MIEMYACARDMFEAARDARRDAAGIERLLAEMRSRDDVRAAGLGGRRPSGVATDGRDGTCARLDAEAVYTRRLSADRALLDEVGRVVHGSRPSGGLASLLGPSKAAVVHWRCIEGESWRRTSELVCFSESWCRDAYDQACDLVDALGAERVAEGEGMAEG